LRYNFKINNWSKEMNKQTKAAPELEQWLQTVTDKIEAELLLHRLSLHREADDEGHGYPLVDALCCTQKDLEIGKQEVAAIAQAVFHVLDANHPPAAAVPEGWKLVPVKPTDEMRKATNRAESLDEAWEAMLAAARTKTK